MRPGAALSQHQPRRRRFQSGFPSAEIAAAPSSAKVGDPVTPAKLWSRGFPAFEGNDTAELEGRLSVPSHRNRLARASEI